jgi:hypothetical protein
MIFDVVFNFFKFQRIEAMLKERVDLRKVNFKEKQK